MGAAFHDAGMHQHMCALYLTTRRGVAQRTDKLVLRVMCRSLPCPLRQLQIMLTTDVFKVDVGMGCK